MNFEPADIDDAAAAADEVIAVATQLDHIAGIDKPTKVQTIDFIIGVGTHVKDDVVRDFIRAVHTNKKALVEGHPNFKAYDPSHSGKLQPRLAYHPAAERYWKETGLR